MANDFIRTFPKEPSRKLSKYFVGGIEPDLADFQASFWEASDRLQKAGWKWLGRGRHRSVFLSPNKDKVVKVSHHPTGVIANFHEHFFATRSEHLTLLCTYSKTVRSKIPIPRVFGLGRAGKDKLLSVICVEHVERTDEGWSLAQNNPWIHDVDVDSAPQVGYTASGRLVCFDWARF